MSNEEEKIQSLQSQLKVKQEDYDFQKSSIEVISKRLAKTIPNDSIQKFINATFYSMYPETDEVQKAKYQDQIITLLNNFPGLSDLTDPVQQEAVLAWDIEEINTQLAQAQADASSTQTEEEKKEEIPEEAPDVQQEGHLYPVKLVSDWTYKLKQYNKQMDDFLKELDELSVDVDITWLCQKVEAFCKRINKAIAWVRFEIIKGLSAMYKQANIFQKYIDPIVNFNPTDIFACLGWVKNVIKFFLGPYLTVVQFIVDFMSYTPPLVSEAASLVGKTASIPGKLINSINIVAEGKDGEKKQIAEVYKDYINIEFEPITMGDIIGGTAEKPKEKKVSARQKQKEMVKQKAKAYETQLKQIWTELKDYCTSVDAGKQRKWVAYPVKIGKCDNSIDYYTYNINLVATSSSDPGLMTAYSLAVDIKGEKWVKTHDYTQLSFNTIGHKVYPMYYQKNLYDQLKPNSELYNNVITYYKNIYGTKSSARTIANTVIFIGYLKSWAEFMPNIPSYLDRIGKLVKEMSATDNKLQELDQPSVND